MGQVPTGLTTELRNTVQNNAPKRRTRSAPSLYRPSYNRFGPQEVLQAVVQLHESAALKICTRNLQEKSARELCKRFLHDNSAREVSATKLHEKPAREICTINLHDNPAPQVCTPKIFHDRNLLGMARVITPPEFCNNYCTPSCSVTMPVF